MLIPQEDMYMHEFNMQNKVVVDVDEQQRRIQEQTRKKEEKIRLALEEKQQKEMNECSFAPKINKKKKNNAKSYVESSAVSDLEEEE